MQSGAAKKPLQWHNRQAAVNIQSELESLLFQYHSCFFSGCVEILGKFAQLIQFVFPKPHGIHQAVERNVIIGQCQSPLDPGFRGGQIHVVYFQLGKITDRDFLILFGILQGLVIILEGFFRPAVNVFVGYDIRMGNTNLRNHGNGQTERAHGFGIGLIGISNRLTDLLRQFQQVECRCRPEFPPVLITPYLLSPLIFLPFSF